MAKPTKAEMTALVFKAFKAMGFGNAYSTYDVVDHAPFIELKKHGEVPEVCFQILSQVDLDTRAVNLVQNVKRSVLEVYKNSIGTEMYKASRLAQTMVSKLVRTTGFSLYYDKLRNTIIVKHGEAIIETCPKVDYQIDVTSNAIFSYLEELAFFDEECKDVTTAVPYTVMGKLHIDLSNGYKVETDCTVEEFNSHWDK